MQKILILGYGKTGKSFESYLKDKNLSFNIFDQHIASGQKSNLSAASFVSKEEAMTYEEFYVSPGINLKKFFNNHIVGDATLISDIDLFFQENQSFKIGITGTNGKSSFTHYLNQALNSVSSSIALGNFGDPLPTNILHDKKYSVIELSSFQLDKMQKNLLDLSVLINITSDHLDYHDTLENYRDAKMKIFCSGKQTIILSHLKSLQEQATEIALRLEPKLNTQKISYKNLPHRLEMISNKIFNDSKSTNIASLKYALSSLCFKGDLLMCGDPKKEKWSNLFIPLVNEIIIFGKHSEEIYSLIQNKNKICFNTMEEAINYLSFENNILFSPGNPSGDDFKNFEERGKKFCELILRENSE